MLAEPLEMTRTALAARARTISEEIGRRLIASDVSGDPLGHVLVFDQLFHVTGEPAWSERADAQLRRMRFVAGDARAGLHGGVAALLFSAAVASHGGALYRGFRAALLEHLRSAFEPPVPGETPAGDFTFDLVSGWAGIALGLAALGDDVRAVPENDAWAQRIRRYLLALVEAPHEMRWRAPSRFSPVTERVAANLGLAHGMCGVIAALCGTAAPDEGASRDTVARAAGWLRAQARCGSAFAGERWPAALTDDGPIGSRQGWCYGTPAAAATLTAAGRSTGDPGCAAVARDALLGLRDSERATWGHDDHALCHGTLGVAVIADTVAEAADSDDLRAFALDLYRDALDAFDASAPFGYRALIGGKLTDDTTFLEGASGIVLALLALDRRLPRTWMLALGIAA